MELYQQMLDDGIAKECSRFVLPSRVPTKMYMTGSNSQLDSLHRSEIHMELRKNIWTLLTQQKSIFVEQFPSIELLEWVNTTHDEVN